MKEQLGRIRVQREKGWVYYVRTGEDGFLILERALSPKKGDKQIGQGNIIERRD